MTINDPINDLTEAALPRAPCDEFGVITEADWEALLRIAGDPRPNVPGRLPENWIPRRIATRRTKADR